MEEYFKFKKVFDKYEDIRKQYLLDQIGRAHV